MKIGGQMERTSTMLYASMVRCLAVDVAIILNLTALTSYM